MIRQARSVRGFTLIEVLIVITLVMLVGVSLPPSTDTFRRTREAILKEDLFRIRDAIEQYRADQNKYPSSLQDLVADGYLRDTPKDPFTDSAETWQARPAEPDPNNPASEPGIYDVKSGSEETAMDRTRYADWD